MEKLAIFSLMMMSLYGSVLPQQTEQLSNIDDSDVYNQMFRMAGLCLNLIQPIENHIQENHIPNDELILDSAIPLLQELQLQLIRASCEIIIYGATTAQKATLTEAIQGTGNLQNGK